MSNMVKLKFFKKFRGGVRNDRNEMQICCTLIT